MNTAYYRFPTHKKAAAMVEIRYSKETEKVHSITLVSYNTDVITFYPADYKLEMTGFYSRTTIKHIGWFLDMFTFSDYYTVKKAYNDAYGTEKQHMTYRVIDSVLPTYKADYHYIFTNMEKAY